jgi:hypothetical protein
MHTKNLRKTIVQLVIFWLILTLGMATAAAQQKYQIAGEATHAIIDQQMSKLDDVLGHTLFLSNTEGVSFSTSETEFMNGARVISVIISDSERFNSSFQGYSRYAKKSDIVYFKMEGNITTSLSEEGNPLTTFDAKFSLVKGTGQYENIHGSGTYKGRYISGYIFTLEWEGEYWIEK